MIETFNNLILGFSVALQPQVLMYAFIGCLIGTLVGMLPGVGPLAGISMLLPATFGLNPIIAIVLLAGVYYGAMYGGSTTSILIRLPGEAASVMTCIDGYAMTQQGRAGPALAIAAIGSFVAGTLGVLGLMLLAPTLASFALRFGPPEYTALLLMGLLVLAYMSGGSMPKTLAMAGLGLILGMIGIDAMSGYTRFAFDVVELSDGIGIVPVAVGLFGVSEILITASQATPALPKNPSLRELMPSRAELKQSVGPIARGSLVGFLIGIIPGSAHIISSFVSYGIERRISKTPERFGHGAIEGVAGPESANNAAATGAFIPMMALGVPTSPVTAVIMVHGIAPGPMLIAQRPDLFWGFVASMYVGNVVLLILNLPLVGLFVSLLRIPYSYLYPCILAFCILGCYSVSNSVVDVWIMLAMGGLGFLLRKFGFDLAPVALGLVLAPMLELSLRQSLAMSAGSYAIFFERPISGVMLGIGVIMLLFSLKTLFSKKKDWRAKVGLDEVA
jgi:putative tricarboxylic transport membrane protein